jgi:hypothetical protein
LRFSASPGKLPLPFLCPYFLESQKTRPGALTAFDRSGKEVWQKR